MLKVKRGAKPQLAPSRGPAPHLGFLPYCRPLSWGPDLVAKPQRLEAVRAALTMCEWRCFWVTSCVVLEVEALLGPTWVTQASEWNIPRWPEAQSPQACASPAAGCLRECVQSPHALGSSCLSRPPSPTKAEGEKGQQIKTIEVTSLVPL